MSISPDHRVRRRTLLADFIRVLRAIRALEKDGCRVLDARLMPSPAVRVDRASALIETWGGPIEPIRIGPHESALYVGTLRGVRVSWRSRRHAA